VESLVAEDLSRGEQDVFALHLGLDSPLSLRRQAPFAAAVP
jgi:hypothetical protein